MKAFKPEDILHKEKKEHKNKLDKNATRWIVFVGLTLLCVVTILGKFMNLSGAEQHSKVATVNSASVNQKVYAVAIAVNGDSIVCVKDKVYANQILDEVKNANLPSDEDLEINKLYFKEKVTLNSVLIDKKQLQDKSTAVNTLLYGNVKVSKYTAKAGDNLWLIARRNNMRQKEIIAANPGLDEENLAIGQVIFLKKPQPQVTVVAELKGVRERRIPYETEYKKDEKLRSGNERVVTEGKNGKRIFTYQLTTVNGVVTDKKILKDRIAEKPVTEVIATGTAKRRATRLLASRSEGGNLMWPIRGSITSPFGYRGGEYHTGIDIDGSTGDPVAAADSGTVTFSGWSGGYGKCVLIDHGNGIVTRYGHLSSYFVSEGERVGRGDIIGNVGSTGRSTGSHLHFEVIVNGDVRSPLRYLN